MKRFKITFTVIASIITLIAASASGSVRADGYGINTYWATDYFPGTLAVENVPCSVKSQIKVRYDKAHFVAYHLGTFYFRVDPGVESFTISCK